VVLYDYDKLASIERLKCREKAAPRNECEETGAEEDWIFATEEYFFIDEIDRYSGIPRPLKGIFQSIHGELLTPSTSGTTSRRD